MVIKQFQATSIKNLLFFVLSREILVVMVYHFDFHSLPKETLFKRGDFNKIAGIYNEMMVKGIARDCAPVTAENMLMFRLYKSAKDNAWLYQIAITRDDKNHRFIYEITAADGKQIARENAIEAALKKFKWHMGDKHNIREWKKPRRAQSDI